jgi:hypothetical protein
MTEQYVVRTSLTNTPSRPFVEEIVQLRARVQAAGTSVFTLAILQEWQTEGSLPSTMISQGFIGACLRSVCRRTTDDRPQEVDFKHKECLESLRFAQDVVTTQMTHFDDRNNLVQTFNQAAREYLTALENNVFMNYALWQKRAIDAEISVRPDLAELLPTKHARKYAVMRITQRINYAKSGPNPAKWKHDSVRTHGVVFADSEHGSEIVSRYQKYLALTPTSENVSMRMHDEWLGVASTNVIKEFTHTFLACGIAMMQRLCRQSTR